MKKCFITGKNSMKGNKVSHSNIKTKCRKKANIQKKRIFNEESKSWVRVNISPKGLKTLYKNMYAR